MSVSLFIFGLIIVCAVGISFCMANDYNCFNDKKIHAKAITVFFIGIIIALTVIGLSFFFVSPMHLIASLKYDHVIVIDYDISHGPQMDIDQRKIIWKTEYIGQHMIKYATVIMAWNDPKPIVRYEELVSKEDRQNKD